MRNLRKRGNGNTVRTSSGRGLQGETASCRHIRIDIHRNSQRLQQHTQDLHNFKLDKIPTLSKLGHKIPSLNKKLFVTNTFWQKENQFSSMVCHLGILTTLQSRIHSQEQVANSKFVLCLCVWFLFLVFFLCLIGFLFDFFYICLP